MLMSTVQRMSWLVAGIFVFAACGVNPTPTPQPDPAPTAAEAASETDEASTAVEQASEVDVRLAVGSWDAALLDGHIASIILEEQLGLAVEIQEVDEFAQWEKLASGELHASLEVWPSGHRERIERYIYSEQTIEDGGRLGVVGKIGWYIPTYMLNANPELTDWASLTDPATAAIFRTEETGDAGRFLAGPTTWTQHDAQIIENLELNLEVVSLEDEGTLLETLDAAYQNNEPILMYFWTPHWAHVRYDLTEVSLPPHTEECYAQIEAGGVDCDYPDENLIKIFWAGLEADMPDVHTVLSSFTLTNRDQIEMLAMLELEDLSVAEAAQRWVDDHEDIWQAWLPS